jgi:DNA-binding CsgD family transcriptional regulator
MLVGRSAESATVDGLLADARAGRSGVLVLRGEAGIGKSALLEHAVEQADGFTVLHGVGVESEADLAYAALHQIMRPVLGGLDRLPEPQAAALRAAFALSSETVDERFRVSLGVLGLLSEAAEERPVLCLVDDAQWLDQASADALTFAARRLEAEALVLLFAARDDDQRPFAARGLSELRLSPLTAGESRTLLTERMASAVASGALDWLVESAGGNPLALLELPTTLSTRQLAGQEPLSGRLPPATSVERAYLERVRALPVAVQRLLVLAAAEETGARVAVERAAAEVGLDIAALEAAEAAGLVRIDSERLVFRHPLVRTAVYRGAPFTERERAHRVLAVASAAAGSPDRAAWHRAAATVGPDEEVAAELESTAERARLRSGHAAAASALDRAAELSATPQTRAPRLIAAASSAWQAGQPDRAADLLDRADPITEDPRLRAEISHGRGVLAWRCGVVSEACATLLDGALEVAPTDPGKALEMLGDAGIAGWDSGDFDRLSAVGDAAAALPRQVDEVGAVLADVLVGGVRLSLGQKLRDLPGLVEAVRRATRLDEPRVNVWAAIAAEVAGESELEATLLARGVAIARASGAVDRLTVVLESATVQGFLSGNHDVGPETTEGLTLAREAGLSNAASLHLATLSWLDAVRGREESCRRNAAEAIAAARPHGHAIAVSIAEWALGLLDLGCGRAEEALSRFQALHAAPPGQGHPYYTLSSAPDLVEAAVRAGRPVEAASAFTVIDRFASAGGPAWAVALAQRCRALLSAGAQAEAAFRASLELHGHGGNPFDRARTELLFGEFLRRERRRGDARGELRAALDGFERLRAEPWSERTRTELRATGETARKRDPSTIDALTAQELQIARLVAEGHANKEVAAQLFLSPRTVEYHLRKVFAKLGISSRAELIRHGVGTETAPALAS